MRDTINPFTGRLQRMVDGQEYPKEVRQDLKKEEQAQQE